MEEKDISKEFTEMDTFAFESFLNKLNREAQKELIVTIRTDDISKAKRLKAIKENTKYINLRFECEIQATIEEYQGELNIFASGIKWVKKE